MRPRWASFGPVSIKHDAGAAAAPMAPHVRPQAAHELVRPVHAREITDRIDALATARGGAAVDSQAVAVELPEPAIHDGVAHAALACVPAYFRMEA